jgi:hypothetical protein
LHEPEQDASVQPDFMLDEKAGKNSVVPELALVCLRMMRASGGHLVQNLSCVEDSLYASQRGGVDCALHNVPQAASEQSCPPHIAGTSDHLAIVWMLEKPL